ncbi:MFS general substrate transporter [Thozetella sp. PMI_491]|nr:MFS general substrate transporter [Thozetella sp. PMI_491]
MVELRSQPVVSEVLDWSGPDDPDNPRNFSLARRTFGTVAVTALAFVGTLGGAIYAPAQDEVAAVMHCSSEVAILPLSLYNLGMAFGPLVGAPLSEMYGRKSVFLATTPIYVIFVLGAGLSNNILSLTMCRFFAGMFASPLISNASATILDSTANTSRGISLGTYYTIPSAAAILGPLVGGFIVPAAGWRWTQWATIFAAVAFFIPVCFTKETYKKVILQRRAARHGTKPSTTTKMSPSRAIRYFTTALIKRPVHMLATELIVTLVSLYNGVIFALMYTFVVAMPWVYREYYAFDNKSQSLAFLGPFIGTIAASAPIIAIDIQVYRNKLLHWQRTHEGRSNLPPESRLTAALLGSFSLPASLLIVGWAAHFQVPWIVPVIFQGTTMLSGLLIYTSIGMYILDAYGPLYGASASGAMMLIRYLGASAFPLFALQMYKALGVGWATTILAVLMLCLAPVPWCFLTYGESLRRRSKYELSI